jgi:hypothetical protein
MQASLQQFESPGFLVFELETCETPMNDPPYELKPTQRTAVEKSASWAYINGHAPR